MRAVAIAADDRLLAVGGRSGVVRLFALPQGERLRDLPVHRQRIRSLVFSPDGSYLASSGEDRAIHILALASGEGFHLPPRPAKVLALAWLGPQLLAAAGSDNLIRLWDVTSRSEIGCLRGHTGSVAALDCRGKVLVSAAYDTTVRVWEISDRVAGPGAEPAGRVGQPLPRQDRQTR
jgi:WD40 repeat protein